MITPPPQPSNSFRITLVLSSKQRIDTKLLHELRAQTRNTTLMSISRSALKDLFKKKRIQLKGQAAVPSSLIAEGTSYVDILGFSEDENSGENSEQTGSK